MIKVIKSGALIPLIMNPILVGTSRCDVQRRGAALPTCFRHLLSCVASEKEDAVRSNIPVGAARHPDQVQGFKSRPAK